MHGIGKMSNSRCCALVVGASRQHVAAAVVGAIRSGQGIDAGKSVVGEAAALTRWCTAVCDTAGGVVGRRLVVRKEDTRGALTVIGRSCG